MATSATWLATHISAVNTGILMGILLLAAFVRFYALDASSLWNDEGTTWALISRSFGQIARDAAADIHPPGYYWALKLWTGLIGTSAWAMRALSASLGVALVFIVFRIGTYLESEPQSVQATALLAALLAALNPFQIYYSQEARMYMLLAVQAAALFWALFALVQREDGTARVRAPLIAYVVCGAAGLWTHYSFPIVLAAAGLAYLIHLGLGAKDSPTPRIHRFLRFAAANALIVLLFLPWLPTAIDRVRNWPQGGDYVPVFEGLGLTLQTFVVGSIRSAPAIAIPWLLLAVLLPMIGLWSLRKQFGAEALGLWLLAPIGMMAVLGLYSEAFLKFLLVASPAYCLLVAAGPLCCVRPRPYVQSALAAVAIVLAVVILPDYYSDPVARDNYAGVARYVQATGDPARDVVVIDAPGQQDVWRYYDPGLPVLPLPEQRPPHAGQTIDRLSAALSDKRRAYAVLWATDESDPDAIVETWLDQNAFKGIDTWQGNMRFVVYSLASGLECRELATPILFGENIALTTQCQPEHPQYAVAGDAATLALHWQTDEPLSASYKVSIQLLDSRNQVIAQHDSEPAGGSRPTPSWAPGDMVIDNHGLPIPPGTPPGPYRLIVAMYDPNSGERLATENGADHLLLGEVQVIRPAEPLPIEVVPIQHRADARMGPVRLAGYAAHAKGQSHAPDTPLHAGDLVHVSLLWQAPNPLPDDWPDDLSFTLDIGGESLTSPLAGGTYPTEEWQPGEIVRGEFDIAYDGTDAVPRLTVATDTYELERLPVE